MPQPPERSDAYEAAREGALGWLSANWAAGRSSTVRCQPPGHRSPAARTRSSGALSASE
jgi:hypothetical protein